MKDREKLHTLPRRTTRPLRQLEEGIRQIQHIFEYKIKLGVVKIVKRLWREALKFVLLRPQVKKLINGLLVFVPWLKTRLELSAGNEKERILAAVENEKFSGVDNLVFHYDAQYMPTPPVIFPSPTGCRKLYYFVDHTILCPSNTAMQRVTRCLARALLVAGEHILFVKWDSNLRRFVFINRDELAHLSQWNGPRLSTQGLEQYPNSGENAVPIEKHELDAGHWLIVPEVTHITYQKQPVTLDVLVEAKRHGLRTAFIYYDATPLRRADLNSKSFDHEIYVQQLLLADLIAPISNWSARDLVSFLREHERASLTPTPRIVALPLAGESQMTQRVTVPAKSKETERFILSVDSVVPHKNQMALLRAFERYCQLNPETDWQLVLVGNLQPDFVEEMKEATQRNPRITHLSHVSDEQLDTLYRSCSFTVFSSVEEGFGLPILESLWYAKPCVCANFDAMGEAAQGGGCFMIDTRDENELLQAIVHLIENPGILDKLSEQAVRRSIVTWEEYGQQFVTLLDEVSDPLNQMGLIYYWVDHTVTFHKNTGIQRVARGLAKELMELGLKLVPVRWDPLEARLYPPTKEDLECFEKWNGPQVSAWAEWREPGNSSANDWLLIPEIVSPLDDQRLDKLKEYLSKLSLRCAWVFHDAIPWKMRDIYLPELAYAHRCYMEGLSQFDLVFPISEFSRVDLISFLTASSQRTPGLEDRIQTCVLPGEFPETERRIKVKQAHSSTIKILCVGSVEPRKNHLTLIEAYIKASKESTRTIELYILGRSAEPDLAAEVQNYVEAIPLIHWEQDGDDVRLYELYEECDFTVYPSLEEGFGLPILESLWFARPCICRNSGAMADAAQGGGCLMVETADPETLADAILRMAEDDALRTELAQEAVNRSFKTWREYAREVATRMIRERYLPLQQALPESVGEAEFYRQFVNLTPRPLLSICITTYNRAEWLSVSLRNLARLLPAPDPDIEIVVCDNASSDHTPQVIQPYLHRPDFHYYRNAENVGMLGNLRTTANHARGRYVWILGEDDLVKPGSIEKVLLAIRQSPDISLVYLNYGYTHQDNPKAVVDLDTFLNASTPIVAPNEDILGTVSHICTESENFFTATSCLVFRRDHALRAYTQNTEGRPFSTLLTCIPTAYYTLNFMMNEPAYWIGDPQVVVNRNVSWMKYAPLWILERIPEVYDLAERLGADPQAVDRWRKHTLPEIMHWFRDIYEHDEHENMKYFSPSRLIARIKHLDTFPSKVEELRAIYQSAYAAGHPGAKIPPSQVFPFASMEIRG